jgi:DNA-binding CsgD family transcriptional regulator/pimeloyl-ACP methyl ester carboxylesterase
MNAAPPVQYVKTIDGYDIAFTVEGDGEPLVVLPFAFSHAQTVWTESSATPLLQALAKRFRVVYYDSRGQGLSQRGLGPDLTVDSYLHDLRAVLDRVGLERPLLLGDNPMSHVALRYAAESPHRVKALALMHCAVSLAEQCGWVGGLARQNWDYFLSVQAGLTAPDAAAEIARLTARMERLRARMTQADFVRFADVFAASDVSATLPKIAAPTLVIHTPSQGFITQEESARVAALIPDSQLVLLSGASFYGDGEEVASTIEQFVLKSAAAQTPKSAAATSLSPREVEVLKLVAAGLTNQQIAGELVISLNTVNRHVSNVYAKTGAANRAEAVSYAHRHRLAE